MTKPPEAVLQRINRRIAGMCGTIYGDVWYPHSGPKPGESGVQGFSIPDFTGSLDAIHDAESTLLSTPDLLQRYSTMLQIAREDRASMVDRGKYPIAAYRVWHTEAWERAIALDRTLSEPPIC